MAPHQLEISIEARQRAPADDQQFALVYGTDGVDRR